MPNTQKLACGVEESSNRLPGDLTVGDVPDTLDTGRFQSWISKFKLGFLLL